MLNSAMSSRLAKWRRHSVLGVGALMCFPVGFALYAAAQTKDVFPQFAVPSSKGHAHFALDFADRHRDSAERISLNPGAGQVVDLKLLKPEQAAAVNSYLPGSKR
jgi:hypothetical protein